MATPKEQHDARPNARTIGRAHTRALPADATPPGGIRALTLRDLVPAALSGDEPLPAGRADAAPREPAEHP